MNLRPIFLPITLLCLTWACSNPGETDKGQAQTQPPAFVFSTKAAESNIRSQNNWCNLPFEEAVVINAETNKLNRRYFAVGSGVYKIVVRKGNTAAPFMVQRKGASLEVFTSDQYPTCLARRTYFRVLEDGRTLKYDNPPYYDFHVETEPWENALKVTIEFPPDTDNGLIVHRQKSTE
ncbi:MAG: hypothetical protein IT270_07720 [Saprospiraceae bacterium]|nr:hypothetical protein [Saprospiraceae bacterium]